MGAISSQGCPPPPPTELSACEITVPHFPLRQLETFLAHLGPSEASCEAGELPHRVALPGPHRGKVSPHMSADQDLGDRWASTGSCSVWLGCVTAHRLGGYKQKFTSHSSGGWEFEIRVLAGLVRAPFQGADLSL